MGSSEHTQLFSLTREQANQFYQMGLRQRIHEMHLRELLRTESEQFSSSADLSKSRPPSSFALPSLALPFLEPNNDASSVSAVSQISTSSAASASDHLFNVDPVVPYATESANPKTVSPQSHRSQKTTDSLSKEMDYQLVFDGRPQPEDDEYQLLFDRVPFYSSGYRGQWIPSIVPKRSSPDWMMHHPLPPQKRLRRILNPPSNFDQTMIVDLSKDNPVSSDSEIVNIEESESYDNSLIDIILSV